MCSRKRLTFIKDFINNESVCHFMVVQLFKLSAKDKSQFSPYQLIYRSQYFSTIGINANNNQP